MCVCVCMYVCICAQPLILRSRLSTKERTDLNFDANEEIPRAPIPGHSGSGFGVV